LVDRGCLARMPNYAAFELIAEETLEKLLMRICGSCLMPNHWHLILWPENDGDLAASMQRLTVTYVTHWQKHGQEGKTDARSFAFFLGSTQCFGCGATRSDFP